MTNRRAVVLVHGWGRFKRLQRRDMLVRSLELNDPLPVKPAVDGDIEGETFKRLVPDDGQDPARPEVDVYEAHWSDMIPTDAENSPVQRFLDASKLMLYWFASPWWIRALSINRSLTAGLVLSGVLLLAWYFVVLVALADFVQRPTVEDAAQSVRVVAADSAEAAPPGETVETEDDGAGDAAPGGDLFELLKPWLAWALSPLVGVSAQQWFLVALAVLSFLPVSTMTDLAAFVRKYHSSGVVEGFDAEVTHRAQEVLRRVYARRDEADAAKPFYDEVFVVGHSMGAVIALEALAPWGHPAVRERTTLITWGSPIAILSLRDPDRLGRRVEAACAGGLPRWIDVHSATDWLSAPIAAHTAAFPNAVFNPRFSVAWWTGFADAHDQYFHHDDVLRMLLAPPKA
jgi:hypothetical protein